MENSEELIAHIRAYNKERQSLNAHLLAVSRLAGRFAEKAGLKKSGEILGLLHDFGKASEIFQNYLLSGEGEKNPDADGYVDPEAMRGKIDHSTAGAQLVFQKLWTEDKQKRIAAQILSLCIASHHSGLIDCLKPDGENNFRRRMEKTDADTHRSESESKLKNIDVQIQKMLLDGVAEELFAKLMSLRTETVDSKETISFKHGLLIRFLLSCLIDADRLDTADFESPINLKLRNYGQYGSWKLLGERLEQKLEGFQNKEVKTWVDELRNKVSQTCFDFARRPQGIYQLSVPTGGGKTLSSLRFALHHADYHNLDRIFCVIPYTSIIDQNANEIRMILEDKDENGVYLDRIVLEHHSNLTPEEESRRQGLLAQNWDAPVVLTTQVQFFEALFGSGTRGARRMHQLANSVIILDEVQTIPINLIQMTNVALRFLVENCGSTVVLCTATQPPLDQIDAQYRALTLSSDSRIFQNERELFTALKRVEVFDRRRDGGWSDDEVTELVEQQLTEHGSVLTIVNTKESAKSLYQSIAARQFNATNLYHLSTNMCPAHRLDILKKIKEALVHERVICVSTQLIEAGVDIDFGAVIRYLAGLDSIAQSAGRCNRHGSRKEPGKVWIVNPRKEVIDRLTDIVIGQAQAQRVLDEYNYDPEKFQGDRIGLQAMAEFYKYYYYVRKDEMSYKVGKDSIVGREDDLFSLLSTNPLSLEAYRRIYKSDPELFFRQSFLSAAKCFRVINAPTIGVVVPYGVEGEDLIADLCRVSELEVHYKLLRKAQRFSINLFPNKFEDLKNAKAIFEAQPGTGIFYLDKSYYDKRLGLSYEPVEKPGLIEA